MKHGVESKPGIQVIQRATAVLRTCRNLGPGLSLGDIARQVKLPRSTVQRIVQSLVQEGFLQTNGDASSIRLGPELLAFADSANVDVVEVAQPYLKRLSEQTGETVDLARFHRDHMIFVNQIPGAHRLRTVSGVGEIFPLHCTANGKAALSLLPESVFDEPWMQDLPKLTPHTKVSASALKAEIEKIRASGIAFDREEHTLGICAAGIAFRDAMNQIYAISIPVPSVRFDRLRGKIDKILVDVTAEIESEMDRLNRIGKPTSVMPGRPDFPEK